MNINCIACGHRFDIGRAYDDYEGLVRCGTCRCLLDIKTVDGQVRSVRMGSLSTPAASPATGTPAQVQTTTEAPPLRVAA
jgi:hypothetical protein